MQQQTPVRMAIAGLSHDHVTWILRNWQRNDLDIAGCWEPDQALARHQGNYSESHPSSSALKGEGWVRFAADGPMSTSARAAANTLLGQATGQASRASVPTARARFPA